MGYVSAPLTEETFPDGSRLVNTEDGGWLILESDLAARNIVGLAHDRPVRYDEPPPPLPAKLARPELNAALSRRLESAESH